MHRAAGNIVLRCPSIQLTLADLSVDFGDNGRLEESFEKGRTNFWAQNLEPAVITFWLSAPGHQDYGSVFSFQTDML